MKLGYSLFTFLLFTSFCMSQNQLKNLEIGYKTNSITELIGFLNIWKKAYKPVSNLDSLSKVQQDVYNLYTEFYNPLHLSKLGKGEFGNLIYNRSTFFIIQNKIFYYVYKTEKLNHFPNQINDRLILQQGSITDFKPKLNFKNKKFLYLTDTYKNTLSKFLGLEKYNSKTNNIMQPSYAKGETAKRLKYLNEKLQIFMSHSGRGWYFETHPMVTEIDFNRDCTLAKVYFRLIYQGGEALYKKENGKWIFLNSKITWIE